MTDEELKAIEERAKAMAYITDFDGLHFHDAKAETLAICAALRATREVLGRVEWGATRQQDHAFDYEPEYDACPCCGGFSPASIAGHIDVPAKDRGHAPDCALAAVLGK